MPPKKPTLVGLRLLCPGSVFKTPDEVYPGVVTGRSSNGANLYVRFDGEEDTRTYYFKKKDVEAWVAAADAAGMNDRESDSEEEGEQQSESDFEIDLGAPSPDAPKLLGKQQREQQQRRSRGLLLLGKAAAAAAVAATKKEAAAETGALSPPPRHPAPSPYSSPAQRTANINDLVGGRGGKGVGKSSGGKGAAAAAKKKGLPQRNKGPSSSPSSSAASSWSLAVPLLAALAALAAFAASWLVLQRVPEPQRTLRFRVPW